MCHKTHEHAINYRLAGKTIHAQNGEFLMLRFQISEQKGRLEKRLSALRCLAEHQVEVGLPESASARNKMILAIQEHGSPIMRIPARPVVRPGLSRAETRQAEANS